MLTVIFNNIKILIKVESLHIISFKKKKKKNKKKKKKKKKITTYIKIEKIIKVHITKNIIFIFFI